VVAHPIRVGHARNHEFGIVTGGEDLDAPDPEDAVE
jgi:hypothetical protein